MGPLPVDQITTSGQVVQAPDSTLSRTRKAELLLGSLPGAERQTFAGVDAVCFRDRVLFYKQITHLGNPWPGFKKRIQIPNSWIAAELAAREAGLRAIFLGIYHFEGNTVFVDFDPTTYLRRKANNSSAHVATNDLYQAVEAGVFTREDRNGNRATSVRSDVFLDYLTGNVDENDPRVEVFRAFNEQFLDGQRLEGLDAIKAMHAAHWPDTFQGEWPGFYLEYRFDQFVRERELRHLVAFQKVKVRDVPDYDLVFSQAGSVEFYGDLKASDVTASESPGNDMADLLAAVERWGRFWYVIYEHETWHARNNGDRATIAWNRWRRSVGYQSRKAFNELSYARRFKEAVRWCGMSVLEVNPANLGVVLSDFRQGRQPSGEARAVKCMIRKRNIDNFLIHRDSIAGGGPSCHGKDPGR